MNNHIQVEKSKNDILNLDFEVQIFEKNSQIAEGKPCSTYHGQHHVFVQPWHSLEILIQEVLGFVCTATLVVLTIAPEETKRVECP